MAAPLPAQYRGLSAGLGGEANGVTVFDDLGAGALFALESRLNRYFALDFCGGASLPVSRVQDLGAPNTFLGFEAQLFLRWYMLSPPAMDTPRGAELFLAAGGGLIAVMNGPDSRDTRGSPEASAILGLRLRLGKHFYLEPYARGGYPSLFGGGLVAGLRFPAKDAVRTVIKTVIKTVVETEVKTVVVEVPGPPESREPAAHEEPPDEPVYEPAVMVVEEPAEEQTEDAAPIPGIFAVYFPPNGPYFTGLDPETIAKNARIIKEVTGLLKKHPRARLLIEGYANPVLGTRREAADTLLPLSRRRATYIARTLEACGIAPDRFVIVGKGGADSAVPISGRENWETNRRVELRIL
jgi:outer membrane protein OmpA-like peptidoglycan-associated protein